jgi:uncharacterized protein (TIGR02680 family)
MLPLPSSPRFQPLRSGLINLFKYQDQEFWYERGRLLIRGNNGSGKSRVLALQLPFLLDGEISPQRVEPDGDPARQIAWHLLMDEHEQRTGYTWIEFGRRDETGREHFVTLGCGMRAIRGGDNQPTRWFFLTEKRVGADFSLLHGTHPLSAERLAEVLGQDCLYPIARDYRTAIDKRLFGLGPERYKALIELLIRLRAPQLAKKLKEGLIFTALSDALPPLASDVVENVAAAFKDLDTLREQHQQLSKLVAALADFQAGYQAYLQTALLRRADLVHRRHNEFESAQRHVTGVERDIAAAEADTLALTAAQSSAKDLFTTTTTRLETLQQSSLANDASRLDYAQQTAAAAQETADSTETSAQNAARVLEGLESEIEQHSLILNEHAAALENAAREAHRYSLPAGFASEHHRLLPDVSAWPADPGQFTKLKTAHAKAAADHLHRIKQIEVGIADHGTALAALKSTQAKEDGIATQLSAQSETIHTHDESARVAILGLADRYATWHSFLRWLSPPPWSEIAPSFDDWFETAEDSHRELATVIGAASRRETAALATAQTELLARRTALAAERKILDDESDALAAGPPPPPVPPATREPLSRVGRPGAPLWQVYEFQPTLTAAERAGLEAALEASGLLDAWLLPDGTLIPDGETPADTFLAPPLPPAANAAEAHSQTAQGPTLASWLQPDLPADPATGLTPDALMAALSRIGAGPSDQAHWVALDGRWRLGPVHGRGQKTSAIHLGVTGREAARQRRLAELAIALAQLDEHAIVLDHESAEQAARGTAAAIELTTAPADTEIARHLTLRTEARLQRDRSTREHETAIGETHRARLAARTAEDALHHTARDLGYGDHLHRLAELRSSWAPYAQAITQLWGDAQAWITSALREQQLAAQQRVAAEHTARTAAEAQASRTTALQAAEHHRTLVQTLGSTIEEYQRDLQAARTARSDAQTTLDVANTAVADIGKKIAALQAALGPAQEKIDEAGQRRQSAILDLRLPLHHGLYSEASLDLADIETDDWSPTRAYTIARRLEKDLPPTNLTDTAWIERVNVLNTQIHDLRNLTGSLGCQVVSRVLGEGLTHVECHYQGTPLTPANCLSAVQRERETHERLLSDGERAIIDRHLVTEVSLQLQTLIENARARTDEMNKEMADCATTLGIALRLVWEPITEGMPAGLPNIRRLLLADHATWSDDERSTVGRFLHQLIAEERIRNPAASGTEQLLHALDYRRWHVFAADRRQNNRWERLTRKRYGTGSGGEKALMLTIPQMAAASSHYKTAAPHAPRFILLDEAFAGMDKPTRARCMGLLESFDLDLLMTSEREWGAHATVSGIAIYQLVADADAVAATRWVWNGRQTRLAPVPDTPEARTPQSASFPETATDELPLG